MIQNNRPRIWAKKRKEERMATRQFSNQPQESDAMIVRWRPLRNSSNEIELSDGTRLAGLPDDVDGEPDPQAKVILCLLAEILTLRERLDAMEQKVSVVGRPSNTPVPELQGEARAFREKVQAGTSAENSAGTPE